MLPAPAESSNHNQAPLPDDLRGANLAGRDLRGLDLSNRDFTGADLTDADLRGASLMGAVFVDAMLVRARLDDCECMTADFAGADLSEAHAERASFGRAHLAGTVLFAAILNQARFTEANLSGADLRRAELTDARLRGADLRGADLTGAVLCNGDLVDTQAARACFDDVDLRRARVKRLAGYESASWVGIDIQDVDFTGAYIMRRFVADQNYLDEMRRRSRTHAVFFHLWKITSDCGRSFSRWALWTAGIATLFALIYPHVGIDYGAHETALSPFYFSVVTLTTLGYGDVQPSSIGGQIVTMIEVCIGYVMLGGLLAIVSNKMARRAD